MQKKSKKITNFINIQCDYILCITVVLMLAWGVIMVLSASAPSALATTGNSYTYVFKQGIFAVVGLFAMFIISRIDYKKYKKYMWFFYGASIVVLLAVLIPGVGLSVNGATRWVKIGNQSFQPSELTKVCLIIFYAAFLTEYRKQLQDNMGGILIPLALLVPPVLILLLVQNHLSVSIIICLIFFVLIFIGGCKIKHFLPIIIGIIICVIGFFGFAQLNGSDSFRLKRLTSFLDADASDIQGTGYQVNQSLYAIGSGGMFGLGLGNSKQKYLYIPEPHNDFIFSILSEELGFIGCFILIGLFMLFIWRGIVIAMKCTDSFGMFLAVGITTQIAFQAIINIAVVTKFFPTTGISLPFFSYGGTALLILLANVGILLNISRSNSKV